MYTKPLHLAVLIRRADMVKLLLEAGARADWERMEGRTLLDEAVTGRGGEVVVGVMLKRRANFVGSGTQRLVHGATPLIAATRNLHRGAMEALLVADPASVCETDARERSVAWWARKSWNSWFGDFIRYYA